MTIKAKTKWFGAEKSYNRCWESVMAAGRQAIDPAVDPWKSSGEVIRAALLRVPVQPGVAANEGAPAIINTRQVILKTGLEKGNDGRAWAERLSYALMYRLFQLGLPNQYVAVGALPAGFHWTHDVTADDADQRELHGKQVLAPNYWTHCTDENGNESGMRWSLRPRISVTGNILTVGLIDLLIYVAPWIHKQYFFGSPFKPDNHFALLAWQCQKTCEAMFNGGNIVDYRGPLASRARNPKFVGEVHWSRTHYSVYRFAQRDFDSPGSVDAEINAAKRVVNDTVEEFVERLGSRLEKVFTP